MRGVVLVIVGLGLAACGRMQPFTPHTASAIPDGPGLFTGKAGAFYILGGPRTERSASGQDERKP